MREPVSFQRHRIAKAAVAAGLVVSMVVSPAAPAVQAIAATGSETQAAKSFSDVPSDAWYAAAVAFCSENGVMNGIGGTDRFGVREPVTTEQLASILWNMAEPDHGSGVVADTTRNVDVFSNQWYTGACNWAKAQGVINGYGGEDRFGIGDPITAERLCTILYNFTGQGSASTSELSAFADADEVSDWARPACAWAKRAGLVNGYPDGTFRPKEEIARERVATIIYNGCRQGVIKLGTGSKDGSKDTPVPTNETYKVSYLNDDGLDYGDGTTVRAGEPVTVKTIKEAWGDNLANLYDEDDYRFDGWKDSVTGTVYKAGQTFTPTADTKLTLQVHKYTDAEKKALLQQRVDSLRQQLKDRINAAGGDFDQYIKGSFGYFEQKGSTSAVDILTHNGYSDQTTEGTTFTQYTHQGRISDATSLRNMRKGIEVIQSLNRRRSSWNTEHASDIASGTGTRLDLFH